MGSLATFKSDYLTSTVVPVGARQQLAGAVYQIDVLVSGGASVPIAAGNAVNKRNLRIIHMAQSQSNPFQPNLVNDYRSISSA